MADKMSFREQVDALPEGNKKDLWTQVLLLHLYAAMPDCDEHTPWHLTPSYRKFRDGVGAVAKKLDTILNLTPLRLTVDRAPLESAEVVARQIGELIGGTVPSGWGFVLMLSSFGQGGYSTYISNQEREDTVKLLREIAGKIERQEPNA